MSTEESYLTYVADDSFMKKYRAYQERYIKQVRESDKVLLRMVAEIAAKREQAGKTVSLLDIGCSTGNLLFHLKNAFPHLNLVGADLATEVIKECQADPRLAGIKFDVVDLLDHQIKNEFDIITVNAVLYLLRDEEYEQAIKMISQALKAGGSFLCFDFFHNFNQDLEIIEKSNSHPKGLRLRFRPYSIVKDILTRNDFCQVEFNPFAIPIDLKINYNSADNVDGFEDLNSYTVKMESGERLLFRGTLFQPWCHLRAQKCG